MRRHTSWVRWFVLLAVPVAGFVPLAAYWQLVGRAPAVTPEEAKQTLDRPDSDAVLVDVRSRSEYAANHLHGAESWPFDEVMAADTPDDVPETLRGKRLLMICDGGILSGIAAIRLGSLTLADATNVRGGMQAWVASATSDLPHRNMTTFEQWSAVIAGFVVKPLYMLLSLILIVLLRRQTLSHLVALRWAMIFFLAGEAACALNYIIYGEGSQLFEYLHSYGMVVCFSFTTYALFEALDHRLIKYSDPNQRCAAINLCDGCIKHMDVPCKLKRLFLLGIPALLVVALMAFCAAPKPVSYNVTILGASYSYTHGIVHQLFEIRFCPVLAMALLAASFLALAFKKEKAVEVSKVLFAAALGPLGFSFFRGVLLGAYRDNMVWFVFWEEATELLFVIVAGAILWVFWQAPRAGQRVRLEV